MSSEIAVAEERRCPSCGSRNVQRSRRSAQERGDYPNGKFYQCLECDARFVRPNARIDDMEDGETPAGLTDWKAKKVDDTGLTPVQYVLVFIASCALTALLIALFGRD